MQCDGAGELTGSSTDMEDSIGHTDPINVAAKPYCCGQGCNQSTLCNTLSTVTLTEIPSDSMTMQREPKQVCSTINSNVGFAHALLTSDGNKTEAQVKNRCTHK